MTEHEQLVELCVGLGSPPAQAEVMARQLAKRAEQLALERGISRVDALRHLLELVVKARTGEDGS